MTRGKWFRVEFFGFSPAGAVPETDSAQEAAALLGRRLGMTHIDALTVTDLTVQPPPPEPRSGGSG